jgi:hypothetical protein
MPKQVGNGVTNFYTTMPKRFLPTSHNPHFEKHKISIPMRMCIIGGSGSMKTNCLMYLISQMPNTWGRIVVCLRTRHEPLYDYLTYKINDSDVLSFHENIVPPMESITPDDPEINTLVIFDDLVMARNLQNDISEYFLRGRKKNISCVYISQSYYAIPKFTRGQCGYIILKKISSTRDLQMILKDTSIGVDSDQLYKIYQYATTEPESFLLIDLGAPPERVFRKNLYEVIDINSVLSGDSKEKS